MTEREADTLIKTCFTGEKAETIIRTREKHELTEIIRILQKEPHCKFEECTFGILTERIIMRIVEDEEIRGVDWDRVYFDDTAAWAFIEFQLMAGRGTNFNGANLSFANMKKVKSFNGATFHFANLNGVLLEGAKDFTPFKIFTKWKTFQT